MSLDFPTDFKEQVRARTDLVELVGESISLIPQRGGSDYAGLCPFHDDHNPSFHVYPDRQSYRCWVCQEGGDCFSFVMKKDGLSFRDTLEFLARRVGLEMPKNLQLSAGREQHQKKQLALYDLLQWAEEQFHLCFLNDPVAQPARDYMTGRGFTQEMIQRFRVGFHPNDWQWLINRAGKRFSTEQLLQTRLIAQSEKNRRYYDFFVNRVLFPIHDERSRTVAFGGRVLPGSPDPAKYWNSLESELFSKSRLLYGFSLAKDRIKKTGTVVVMEGYTDTMMAHQCGVTNAVATLGTALTSQHVTNLKRFARRVVLVYDGDEAGRMAAEKALTKFLAQEVDLRILTLPEDLDPADYFQTNSLETFEELVEQSPEAWEYKLQCLTDRVGLDTIDARQRVLDEMLRLLLEVPRLSGTARENMMLSQLSRRIGEDERILRTRLTEIRQSSKPASPTPAPHHQPVPGGSPKTMPAIEVSATTGFWQGRNGLPDKYEQLEREILEILFTVPETVTVFRQEVGVDEFQNPHLRQLLQVCYDLDEDGLPCSYPNVTSTVELPILKNLAALIDELARDHQIAELLPPGSVPGTPLVQPPTPPSEFPGRTAPPGSPSLLTKTLQNFRWRREEQQHQLSKGRFARKQSGPKIQSANSATPPISAEALDMLRQATEFHQRRAKKNTEN